MRGTPTFRGHPGNAGEGGKCGREPRVTSGEDAAQVHPGALVRGVSEDGVLHQLQLWGGTKGAPQYLRGAAKGLAGTPQYLRGAARCVGAQVDPVKSMGTLGWGDPRGFKGDFRECGDPLMCPHRGLGRPQESRE